MKQCVAYGVNSKKVVAEGTEPEIHQKINEKYPCFKVVEKRKDGRTDKERMIDPVLPEAIRIVKAGDFYAGMV